jgi:hypothetical protein
VIGVRGRPEHDVHRQAVELLAVTAPEQPRPARPERPRWNAPARPLPVVTAELRAAWATVGPANGDTAASERVDRLRAELAALVAVATPPAHRRGGGSRGGGRVL